MTCWLRPECASEHASRPVLQAHEIVEVAAGCQAHDTRRNPSICCDRVSAQGHAVAVRTGEFCLEDGECPWMALLPHEGRRSIGSRPAFQLKDGPRPCARVRWRGPRQSEKPEQRADRLPQQGHSRLPALMPFAVCSAYVLSSLCGAPARSFERCIRPSNLASTLASPR